jgi:hypothetical protein
MRVGDVAQQRQHQRDRVLRSGDRVAGGGVHHHHAGTCRGFDVDAVDADARDADHAQARSGSGEKLGVHARLRTDDQGIPAVGLTEPLEEIRTRHAERDVGFVGTGEDVDPGLGDRLDDEDAGHRSGCYWYRRAIESGCGGRVEYPSIPSNTAGTRVRRETRA